MFIAQAYISIPANFVFTSNVYEFIEDLFDLLLVQFIAIMLFSIDLTVRVVVTIPKLRFDESLVLKKSTYFRIKRDVADTLIEILEY